MRGDFDIGLSGIEDTPARRAAVAASDPVLPVSRSPHRSRGRSRQVPHARRSERPPCRDARRHDRVRHSARGATHARHHRRCRTTTTSIRTSDTLIGRVDAVLLDNVLAARSMWRIERPLSRSRRPSPIGHYIIITAPEHTELRDRHRRAFFAAPWRTAASKRSSANGNRGTTISRSCMPRSRSRCQAATVAPVTLRRRAPSRRSVRARL